MLLLLAVLLCNGVDQNAIDYISNNLDIQFKVVNNLNGNNENYNARITLMNKGTDDIVEVRLKNEERQIAFRNEVK